MVLECLCLMLKLTSGLSLQRRPPESGGQEDQDFRCQLSFFPSITSISGFRNRVSTVTEKDAIHEFNLMNFPSQGRLGYHHYWMLKLPAVETSEFSSICEPCRWHGQPPIDWLFWTPFIMDLVQIFLTRMDIYSGYRFDFPPMFLLTISSVDLLKA